jgi:K+-transporting ATPase ATPase C chain
MDGTLAGSRLLSSVDRQGLWLAYGSPHHQAPILDAMALYVTLFSKQGIDGMSRIATASPTARNRIASLARQLRTVCLAVFWLTLITGGVLPMALLVLGGKMFSRQAAGSLVSDGNTVVGSALIGQSFTQAGDFQTRPSAAGAGYDGLASGGSSLAPGSSKLLEAVRRAAADYRARNGLAPDAVIPIDAVTASGSGLDPHISPQDAALQTPRVARARGLGEAQVRELVAAHTEGRQLGILGEPRVDVLALNLALRRAVPSISSPR